MNAVASTLYADVVDAGVLNQAWETQSVLLYYSFCSVLPLKIINQLFIDETAAPSAPRQDTDSRENSKSGSTAAASCIVSEYRHAGKLLKHFNFFAGAPLIMTARTLHLPQVVVSRSPISNDFIAILMLMLLVLLPRGRIEDAAIINIKKLIGQ